MQENISVTHARNLIADDAGSEIQAMLSPKLKAYKTISYFDFNALRRRIVGNMKA